MTSETGTVYKIQNTSNGKIYIGCTLFAFGRRIAQHMRCIGSIDNELYNDMNSNILDFTFSIVETGIPSEKLKEKETEWIRKCNSINAGYNSVAVSGNEKLSDTSVSDIQSLLLSTDFRFSYIASLYHVSETAISDINRGKAWYSDRLIYPLRRKTRKRKKLTMDEISQIHEQLRDPSLTFGDIAASWGWESQSLLRQINNGTHRFGILSKDSYPIRAVDSRKGKRKKDKGVL